MMDTYEGREDLTLELLKIYPMKTLALEEKASKDTEFTPYDPTKMQIKIILQTDDIYKEHMSLLDFIEAKAARIRVPRGMPMAEFKQYVEKKFGYKDAVIMKRTPLVQERDVEILTEMASTKGLNELRVNEGVNLYVEEKMTEEEFNSKKFHFQTRWENEFDVEKNSYNIRFNKIREATPEASKTSAETPAPETTKENIYTESIVIDKRSIVEDLKK